MFGSSGNVAYQNPMERGHGGGNSHGGIGGMSVAHGMINHHRDPTAEMAASENRDYSVNIEMSNASNPYSNNRNVPNLLKNVNDMNKNGSGEGQKGHHQRNSTEMPDGWEKRTSAEGEKYYIDTVTSTSHWDLPSKDSHLIDM